jgi:valyl-tRNA synthetase
MPLPERYNPQEIEPRWQAEWARLGIYAFDPAGLQPAFSIDTPPPTVSGELHVGHVFSYTHTDLAARFHRMCGRNVFYPMGWDDNGLPSERRVQNLLKVRCEPSLPYEPDLRPGSAPGRDARATSSDSDVRPVSRRNFLELCAQVTAEDERAFEALWRRLGLSVDWSRTYATISERSRRASQLAFLDLVRKGEAYSADAPTMWDVDFRTAVAQAEVEDREVRGTEFRLRFAVAGGGALSVMTTRPELLGACVGVVVHPEDGRYRGLVGRTALTPAYRARVPILAHQAADPAKGTGAVMVCTFGDATDVVWWEELGLATRVIIGRDGRILPAAADAGGYHKKIEGLSTADAKRAMAKLLREPGAAADGSGLPPLEGEPRPIVQTARFYEKGERPLEFLITRQWFIRLLDKTDALIEQGRKVRWHPDWMRVRYERWVEGLRYDWCVSRQRYHGVPMPLWYPVDAEGRPRHEEPLLPADDRLPVDPMAEAPDGYGEDRRGRPGGFCADSDVLDTWATSSLTPRIAAGWPEDEALCRRLLPMDLRPQSHEIIRTWAFYTIARAWMMDRSIPWRHVAVSGWVVDPDRRKMSKSKGNVVTPMGLLERYGADAVRYWSARARLAADTVYDESAFQIGKRLATKLFNAGKLIVGRVEGAHGLSLSDATAPLDRAHLALLAETVREATGLMEEFETAAALETVERWFWANLCDNYLELTKGRAYAGDRSALAAWGLSLSAALRLFAPFLPYVTEEVWSWQPGADGSSVHRAQWPQEAEFAPAGADVGVFTAAVEVLGWIRRHKAEAHVSMREPIEAITVSGPPALLDALQAALADVLAAGAVGRAELRPSDGAALEVMFG